METVNNIFKRISANENKHSAYNMALADLKIKLAKKMAFKKDYSEALQKVNLKIGLKKLKKIIKNKHNKESFTDYVYESLFESDKESYPNIELLLPNNDSLFVNYSLLCSLVAFYWKKNLKTKFEINKLKAKIIKLKAKKLKLRARIFNFKVLLIKCFIKWKDTDFSLFNKFGLVISIEVNQLQISYDYLINCYEYENISEQLYWKALTSKTLQKLNILLGLFEIMFLQFLKLFKIELKIKKIEFSLKKFKIKVKKLKMGFGFFTVLFALNKLSFILNKLFIEFKILYIAGLIEKIKNFNNYLFKSNN